MKVHVALESPRQPEVVALIEALDAHQKPLYPAASFHGIDIEALAAPAVLFAVARLEDRSIAACGALVLTATQGELKRMYTLPARRGHGIATALLRFLEAEARARGCASLALETGYLQTPALALYERCGYLRTGPFGSYRDDPNSVFMQKSLERAPADSVRDVSIWRATAADVAEVAPLFDLYRQFYGRPANLELADEFLRERLTRRESVVLLARAADGAACGFVQLYPSFSSVRATRGYLLNDLFVPLHQRRRGIGRLLLEAAAALARAEDVPRLKLFTAASNTPAQRLYEALGWVRDTDYFEYNLSVARE